jgi:hypothetical protein
MSSHTTCVIVPLLGDEVLSDAVLGGLTGQVGGTADIWVYANRIQPVGVPEVVHWRQGDWDNLAVLFDQAFRELEHEFVMIFPPYIVPEDECVFAFFQALHDYPDRNFVYSDYRVSDGGEVRLIDDPGDITERQDWGQVYGMRGSVIMDKGGVDVGNPAALFYDLRLKLCDDAQALHIPRILYEVPAPPAVDQDIGRDVLFFPGQGQYGGFSYLFADEEETRQIEQVFYNMLKRRGTYLDELPHIKALDVEPLGSPAVTVVIPVFNRRDYIGKAIESVLGGTFQDFELLVVDNGSDDGTCDEVLRYTEDQRVRLLHCAENIIAKSLNTGVAAAQGRYVAQLDSDDEYMPDTLKSMVGYLEDNPDMGLAISYYELMDEGGNSLEDFGIIKHLEYNKNNILRVDGAGAVRVWRKSVLKEMGGFDERELGGYGEDYDLVLKVSERYQVGRVHEVLYRYRRHGGNTDALIDNQKKIRAKSLARQNALLRRRELNLQLQKNAG